MVITFKEIAMHRLILRHRRRGPCGLQLAERPVRKQL